jgi:putative FmdB family regulatory protein
MAKYIYYCGECRTTFEVEIEHAEDDVPLQTACPTCGNLNAMKAFSAEDLKPAGGCAPGSGC